MPGAGRAGFATGYVGLVCCHRRAENRQYGGFVGAATGGGGTLGVGGRMAHVELVKRDKVSGGL